MDRNKLLEELKAKIIKTLSLPETTPADIPSDAPLFEDDGLGLDSVDALDLVLMLETDYGISIDGKAEAKSVFASVNAMADFIISSKK